MSDRAVGFGRCRWVLRLLFFCIDAVGAGVVVFCPPRGAFDSRGWTEVMWGRERGGHWELPWCSVADGMGGASAWLSRGREERSKMWVIPLPTPFPPRTARAMGSHGSSSLADDPKCSSRFGQFPQ